MGTEIHFGPKSDSVESLMALARTTPSATVFVDDNVGELAEVISRFPDINLVVGGLKSTTRHWLQSGIPGIKWGTRDDNVEARVADIKARRARDDVAKNVASNDSLDSSSFLREMGIELHVKADDSQDLPRIIDMISRTNQFNTNLDRKTEAELLEVATKSETHWVTVGLRDKFVDSGVIFAIVVERNEFGKSSASNFVMSCRAMGRGLEPLIVRESIRALAESTQETEIFVPWISGPRNQPALEFLKENSVGFSSDNDEGVCTLSESTLIVPDQLDGFIKITRERFSK
jgi:FkbH-like protein